MSLSPNMDGLGELGGQRREAFTPGWIEKKTCTLEQFQQTCIGFVSNHGLILKYMVMIGLLLGYCVYLIMAVRYNAQGSVAILIITGLVVLGKLYDLFVRACGDAIDRKLLTPASAWLAANSTGIAWIVCPCLFLSVIIYLSFVITEEQQLQSLLGLVFCMMIPFLTCKHPAQIRWRPVIWGLTLQFLLGVFTLRWKPGYQAMQWLSDQINTFLNYALEGAALAFGDPFFLFHPVVMMVFPIIIYIGAVTGILYWMGVVQACVRKMSYFMSLTLGTTGVESVNIVLNIFLSVTETTTIMRPYLPKLTRSEFHCLLVGSHASIAGFAYALFIMVGVDGRHLLTASLMSAPAAIAISKLNFPETEESQFTSENECNFDIGTSSNPGQAMAEAAMQAGKTCLSMLVQLVAFFSIYGFMDACLAYLGSRVGVELSFQIIFSALFLPVAYMIGVQWSEADTVASVLGMKLTINEILAYFDLGGLRRSGALSERASMLTTYAICGFSSFGTLAMFVGVWATVVPSRATEMARLVPRVYINTNISCFLTACVAGILYNSDVAWTDPSDQPRVDVSKALEFMPSYKDLLDAVGY